MPVAILAAGMALAAEPKRGTFTLRQTMAPSGSR